MPLNNSLEMGNNIRKWRSLKGFKQITFAELIGTSKTTLSKIENGKSAVSVKRLQKMAVCLNIKTTQLFSDPSDL
ncbi:MAG: helix-turn-helix transcriptional regulator, partial [Ferruginibacter sp.]